MIDSLYRFLDVGESPRPCDCIFVLAGRPERKVYGIDLWRQGYAPELILSVDRFEWRGFYTLGLPGDGGLRELVRATPPPERHFFISFRNVDAKAILIQKSRLGTMTEGRALAAHLHDRPIRSLMVISSAVHLRRVAMVFRHMFRKSGTALNFVSVPSQMTGAQTTAQMMLELKKYLFYRLVISLRL